MITSTKKQHVILKILIAIATILHYKLDLNSIGGAWKITNSSRMVDSTKDHNHGIDRGCSLKKQWGTSISNSNVSLTCPEAWPIPSSGMRCCNKMIASVAYTSKIQNNSHSSSSCETLEQQVRRHGASLLQGKKLLFIGDSVGNHWLNSMLLDAHNNKEESLFHSNQSIWKEYYKKSDIDYEYDESAGFCTHPYYELNMSSIWPHAPSVVTFKYPNELCPPYYKKELQKICCPHKQPLSYTGAISVKLNEIQPDIVIAQMGVHFHSISSFQTVLDEMLMMLGNYSVVNPDSLVLFLESLPQHFDSPDGSGSFDGFEGAVNRSAWQCLPLNSTQIEDDLLLGDASVSVGIHNFNRIARRAVEETKGAVHWLSSNSDVMGLRNDGHKGATGCCRRHTDCTHLCYAPNLWQPAIDPFYNALKGWFHNTVWDPLE